MAQTAIETLHPTCPKNGFKIMPRVTRMEADKDVRYEHPNHLLSSSVLLRSQRGPVWDADLQARVNNWR